MRHLVRVVVNGKLHNKEVDSRQLLVHFLRRQLGLKGPRIGCDTGHCGACTIFLNGSTAKSCMIFAVQANNSEILTVEGLSDGRILHPLQESFRQNHALQCGYCTPGMLMSALFLLKRNAHPTEEEIRKGLAGNLCMCTGYVNILNAVQEAAQKANFPMTTDG